MSLNRRSLLAATAVAAPTAVAMGAGNAATPAQPVRYRTVLVDGVEIFFRDAGPRDAPAVLLLHGFPTSSHMFRDLIPRLADRWRVVAPDLPGFGYSAQPDRAAFRYGFEALSRVAERFTEVVGLSRYALYVFDYGAPVGFRLFLRRPERVTAIVSQNGNAYEEGLLPAWDPTRRYWADPSAANREALRSFLTEEITRYQYEAGVADRRSSARTPGGATRPSSTAPATPRSSSICSSTTPATSRPTPRGSARCARIGRRSSRPGDATTRSSARPAPRRSCATCRRPRSTCSTPATSRWRRTTRRSPR